MSSRTLKKLLLSLIAIGILGSVTTGGTYAVFKSDTTNLNSNVVSGTLTMSDQVNTGTVCVSTNGSGTPASGTANWNTLQSSPASAGCAGLVTSATLNYPGTLVKVDVTITNTGSVSANDLSVFMPMAAYSAGPPAVVTPGCTKATTTGATVVGAGNPCSATGDLFYVEEETDATFSTPLTCWYPAGTSSCSIGGGGTLYNFSTNYDYSSSLQQGAKLDLGSGPAAQRSRYFVIGIQEGNANNLQGLTASFPLTWHMDSN